MITAELPLEDVVRLIPDTVDLPSDLACVRFNGWRSHIRTRLVFSGERLARGVDCRTQADFAHLASFYGMKL